MHQGVLQLAGGDAQRAAAALELLALPPTLDEVMRWAEKQPDWRPPAAVPAVAAVTAGPEPAALAAPAPGVLAAAAHCAGPTPATSAADTCVQPAASSPAPVAMPAPVAEPAAADSQQQSGCQLGGQGSTAGQAASDACDAPSSSKRRRQAAP